MLRVSDETRRMIIRIGAEEFGGASADETVRRLIAEHWRSAALAAVERYRAEDPAGWAEYLREAEHDSAAQSPVSDGWDGPRR